ncbi:acetate--CoA ligase family protein [Hydrogenophaga atypica]|uniref:Acetate--CoA ligase family protein n=1 Tax=Hydrogenophaga atypica TaxID=249409 RepID=A0ABW2QHA2_9BURK
MSIRPTISLDALMRPRSVAIIGASTQAQKVGGMPVRLLREYGFEGRILPVHPEANEIQGLPAVPSLRHADAPVDMAIVCVPRASVQQAIADCVDTGVKAAVVFTGGFAEAGDSGLADQQAMVALANGAGMTLLGPNCLGAINLKQRMFATFTPAALAGAPPAGSIGMVSQSGAFGAYAYTLARQQGLGLSHWITTGNEAGVQVADAIDWMVRDPDTRVILAYLEGCKDGPALVGALRAALEAGKPVVVTKVGRTAAGARAALSHTASMAGEDTVFDAVFEECGAIRAHTIEEFFRYGQLFAQAPIPRNNAVAIVTGSGGVGTLMADRAEDLGLELPPFTEAESAQVTTEASLATTINPIDVTGQVMSNLKVFEVACDIAATNGRYGGLALFTAAGALAPHFWAMLEQCARRAGQQAGVTTTVAGIMSAAQRKILAEMGCLVYEEPTHAIEALAMLRCYATAREQRPAWPQADLKAKTQPTLQGQPSGSLSEAAAMQLLQDLGIPTVPQGVAHSAEAAVAIAEQLGGPVAVKVLSADIAHKSDVGGVRLNVQGADAVRAAFNDITASVAVRAPQARVQGVVVARMVKPVLECVVASRVDPVFGPVLTFGLGGTDVEWHQRIVLATAPVPPERVRALLERLDLTRRLDGWRGGPRVTPEALVACICAIGQLAASAGPALQSLEINPLMVNEDGVFAADALIQLEGDPA